MRGETRELGLGLLGHFDASSTKKILNDFSMEKGTGAVTSANPI